MNVIDRFKTSFTASGRYQMLVDSVTDYAICMLDTSGIVKTWNRGAERMIGYREPDIVGQNYSVFYSNGDRRNRLPERALETSRRAGSFQHRTWRVRRDRSQFWASVVIDPVHDAAGGLIGFVEIVSDLTEAKNVRLQRDRTREALFQSQKLEAVGQLTGGIAHDFNNLLMAVLGSLEVVGRRLPDDPRITPLLNNAKQAVERGTSLVQRMLAFARRQDLKPRPVNLSDVVVEIVDRMPAMLDPAITLTAHFPSIPTMVFVDPDQLELVLSSLIANARDAMPDGGRITIGAWVASVPPCDDRGSGSRRHVCLYIADSGTGMDQTILTRAAEPFFTTKGLAACAGLGLSMAYGFVEQSGGQFGVRSSPGSGTMVELWFPIATLDPRVSANDPSPAAAKPAERASARQHQRVVLVVNDDRVMLMHTTSVLNSLGHQVYAAASAGQALCLISRQATIDLVLIDQAVAAVDRAQLAETIRSRRPGLTVIVAASHGDEMPSAWPQPRHQDDLAPAIAGAGYTPMVGVG